MNKVKKHKGSNPLYLVLSDEEMKRFDRIQRALSKDLGSVVTKKATLIYLIKKYFY